MLKNEKEKEVDAGKDIYIKKKSGGRGDRKAKIMDSDREYL